MTFRSGIGMPHATSFASIHKPIGSEVRRLPEFVDSAVKEIDDRLIALKDEASRLEAARAALTGGGRRPGRPAASGSTRTQPRSSRPRNGRPSAPQARRSANTRATQALELVREQPGITIPEIAKAMKIQPNYLYRVLPRLASDGEIKRDGNGWHAASASTSAPASASVRATPVRGPARRRARGAQSEPKPAGTRSRRTVQNTERTSVTGGRTARGATTASVLAALAAGEAMTAGQVAAKAGLARPTVSTTLSKLAKSGDVQKAKRGYRLANGR